MDAQRRAKESAARGTEGGEEGRTIKSDRWRSSWVHLVRLMHRTGSSNGRVGHEYLINNYYRETHYFCEEKESRGLPPPFSPCAVPYHEEAQRPLRPLFFNPALALSLSPSSAIVPDFLPPQRRAPCRHICIFIRECNRRARFSPLVVRCHGKNSRKMAERFAVDMRSDFLLHPPAPPSFPPSR